MGEGFGGTVAAGLSGRRALIHTDSASAYFLGLKIFLTSRIGGGMGMGGVGMERDS